ncbi:OB-fold domain-containing protein [Pigmentiphaga sp.]|uniref:Zn-ribbon domain-containing OB-fold protein n=1 Tax=Pigmentiphaga sp. TaxID=1977564 RepID=UPI0025F0651B|nr:OB-fold domain-containing protein [Pigmentiphaga sp.]
MMSASSAGLLAPYREAAGRGVFLLPRCGDCAAWQWPPRAACRRCGGALAWGQASGGGRLATWSVVTRAPRPELQSDVPYVVAFVELDEGVRLFSRVVGADAGALRAGMRVGCRFDPLSDSAVPVPVFVVAEG